MAKYKVVFTPSFENNFKKTYKPVQKLILEWIDKNLIDVDFPLSPGKSLKSNFRNYVRFRIGKYRIISFVENNTLLIMLLVK